MTLQEKFPYSLDQLLYWVIKKKDGTLIKFIFQDPGQALCRVNTSTSLVPFTGATKAVTCGYSGSSYTSLKDYCNHTPDPTKPLFVSKDNKLKLYVADAWGVKEKCDQFDLVLDCGDVLTPRCLSYANIMLGDQRLVTALKSHIVEHTPPQGVVDRPSPKKLLQLYWIDRAAPLVSPSFWPDLYARLTKEKIHTLVTNCQGGHGRSGTAFVSLLMCAAPDYNASDAIIHLRALHCPRAIESVVQHSYIDLVALHLGREGDSEKVKDIKSYKEAFAASTKPTAVMTRELLKI